jgi:hypothetical protein
MWRACSHSCVLLCCSPVAALFAARDERRGDRGGPAAWGSVRSVLFHGGRRWRLVSRWHLGPRPPREGATRPATWPSGSLQVARSNPDAARTRCTAPREATRIEGLRSEVGAARPRRCKTLSLPPPHPSRSLTHSLSSNCLVIRVGLTRMTNLAAMRAAREPSPPRAAARQRWPFLPQATPSRIEG